uniref:RNA-directed DNA polymerase, eukaryota n=1 Tax=Tanacetum cinerariifolium TaxID=118510 RepID=A0A6L2JMZ8_TANCI|nr:RNA-directed DNA polymerase, eukaryota [Tanacetum cinerariifolium]
MSFSKRPGKNTPQCYTKPLDSLKNWNNCFFWVDERVFPAVVDWRTNASKDGMPTNGTYSVEDVRALDTHRTPIQKQPEMLVCMVGISRRYYLGDEVYPTFHYDDDQEINLFSLIRAPNPTKVKTGSRPHAPHEVLLLTLTAPRVIEMDEPAIATDSSGVPSTIERSPLDFAHEAEASGRGTAAPEMPPPEDVPTTTALGADQAVETVAVEPPAAQESHKRGHEGTDANAPPKSLRGDHADLRPSGVPADVSDPDLFAFADAPLPHPADVAQVIKALHGYDGKIGQKMKSCYPSLRLDIIHEVEMFKSRGIDLIDVALKLSHLGLDVSFRRPPRGGVEIQQFEHMKEKVEGCILADMMDRWFWALKGSGEFTIMSIRKLIDDFMLPKVSSKTRWIKAVPIKVNVHAWKVKLDGLPTRLNISRRDDRNGMVRFKKKMQFLKKEIWVWVMDQKQKQSGRIKEIKFKLSDIDKLLDQGGVNDAILLSRMDLLKQMQDIKSSDARDCMQKAKIQWAIEGDENSKFFHGINNRKRANLAIKGVMVDDEWMDDPSRVAKLENPITRDEIRNAVWACGENKSPGLDGFTFEFFQLLMRGTGIKIDSSLTISHLFYADDAMLIGEWSNANLTGVGTSNDTITAAALNLGCSVMKTPFKYLRVMVGGNSSTIKAWDGTIGKLKARLSNWKLKTLSIGGRLTLLKSILGSTPVYNMSLYKVPKSVLHLMESIRRNFFNGIQGDERKITWVKWSKGSVALSLRRTMGLGPAWEKSLSVKDLRNLLDESFLPKDSTTTRWVKSIPIKINVFAWKVYLDRLPTRLNLIRRDVQVPSLSCPVCNAAYEDMSHLLFSCDLANDVVRFVCRWWNLTWSPLGSYSEWLSWFNSIRLCSRIKGMLEGVFYVTWWCLWNFRNQLLFATQNPRKDVIFDDIVSRSFTWCRTRCNRTFSWDSLLQHPYLISL